MAPQNASAPPTSQVDKKQRGVRNAGGNEDGEEQNAPADDVGNDDRRPIQRTEAAFEAR